MLGCNGASVIVRLSLENLFGAAEIQRCRSKRPALRWMAGTTHWKYAGGQIVPVRYRCRSRNHRRRRDLIPARQSSRKQKMETDQTPHLKESGAKRQGGTPLVVAI